ncbi:MAG: CBS domain-containing protein, partial [Desulfohalobiaceae bacterium]|nr:CBS domain-containing protein [Desulfohalobiaceae bacterium]
STLQRLLVKDSMRTEVHTIPESLPLQDIIETFKNQNAPYLHVINDQQELTGIISFRDIRSVLNEDELQLLVIAKDLATRNPTTVFPDDSLENALEKMTSMGINQLPVVSNGKLVGTLPESEITAAYTREMVKREIEER